MTEQLNPHRECPFCGSLDIEVSLNDEYYNFYECECNNCTAGICGKTEEEAILKWNTRTEKQCEHDWESINIFKVDCVVSPRFCTRCNYIEEK